VGIELQRVGRAWPKQYLVTVTPPHGEWKSTRPLSKRAIRKRLYANGNHSTDVGDAFSAADAAATASD
jgi:hypothetical protein